MKDTLESEQFKEILRKVTETHLERLQHSEDPMGEAYSLIQSLFQRIEVFSRVFPQITTKWSVEEIDEVFREKFL